MGGNAASFLMEQEKLTYREALEELAKKALGNEKADQIASVRDAIDAKIGNEGKK